MAYIKIQPIHSAAHLGKALDYAMNGDKTEDKYYVDFYMCSLDNAILHFNAIRNGATQMCYTEGSGRKEILGWHIIQSFSPGDNITPELALQIGKEFMEKKFPNYQYVIGTHTDKDHIHNHIIMNSVDFVEKKKLHTNKKNYYEMRDVSDALCEKYDISVIEKNSKSHTQKLKDAIDEAVENSNSMDDFLSEMQQRGYIIKRGKNYFSFKNANMRKFIRSTSISLDYTEKAIETRIETRVVNGKSRTPKKHRQLQDDKIMYSSKRKRLKVEIDNSIKKCTTYEEFKADMERKGFVIKDKCKHIAFKETDGERFLRGNSLGIEYSEDFIRYRLEYKEEWSKMNEIIPKKYDKRGSHVDAGLAEWMAGENSHITIKMWDFYRENGIVWNGDRNTRLDFYNFMKKYNAEKEKIVSVENDINEINGQIRECIKIKNAVKIYRKYKPTVKQYANLLSSDTLDSIDQEEYKRILEEYNNAVDVLNFAKERYNLGADVISMNAAQMAIDDLMADKKELIKQKVELQYNFQNWENVKYNLELTYGVSEQRSNAYVEELIEKEKQKQAKKGNSDIDVSKVLEDAEKKQLRRAKFREFKNSLGI